jgi:DNA invertase Pin-like site-specific DNA recombinase
MRYAYVRVSTKEQKVDRQKSALKNQYKDLDDLNIYSDKQSGRNFNRPEYQALKTVLKAGDELIIKELDRLGRNKEEIKSELEWFKQNKIQVRILDVPTSLMEFNEQSRWMMDVVNNIIIEVMSSMAQQELVKIRQRQAEGIAIAKAEGKFKGRRPKEYNDLKYYFELVKSKAMSTSKAIEKLGISKNHWYRLLEKNNLKVKS